MSRTIAGLGRLLPILALGVPVLAQGTQSGAMIGEVVDKKGLPVADADVRLTSPSLQGVRTARTDARGSFSARLLPPGEYTIEVAKTGFQTLTIKQRIYLEVTEHPRLVISTVGSAVVEVVAAAPSSVPQADPGDMKSATNFTKAAIDALPVSRNPIDFAELAPGVIENVNKDKGGMQIRGAQGTGNLWLLDGQNYADNAYNGPRTQFVTDSVEETQVITGAVPAEYGSVEGGVINTITKSGGDEFTGQLRFDFKNLAWNAVQAHTDHSMLTVSQPNHNLVEKSLGVGGYIVKEKLWFYVSAFKTSSSTTGALDGGQDTPNVSTAPYAKKYEDSRYSAKLTWTINPDNTLIGALHHYTEKRDFFDYLGAGSLDTFSNRDIKSDVYSLQWKAILGQDATLSTKIGQKTFNVKVAPMVNTFATVFNRTDQYSYGQGLGDVNDPGTERDQNTANIKFSYFLNAVGSHQFDLGFDYYQGSIKSLNPSTSIYTNGFSGIRQNVNTITVDNWDVSSQTGNGYQISLLALKPGKLVTTTNGFYANDKWDLNKNLTFNLGFRYDTYDSKDTELGKKVASAGSFSPRLGVKYDPTGEGTWLTSLSWSRLTGRPLEVFFERATYVENPVLNTYDWTGAGTPVGIAQLMNPANYTANPSGVTDGTVNVKVDSHLKPQTVDEIQLSGTRNIQTDAWGSGYVKVSYINKKWNNLVDVTSGNNGQVANPSPGGSPLFVQYWHNADDAHRTYKSVEFETQWQKGNAGVQGTVVWSKLEGNFDGEAKSTPGSGESIEFFTVQNGVRMYDPSISHPDGFLNGHRPLRVRATGFYDWKNPLGKLNIGLVYRFDSGQRYSISRNLTSFSALNPAIDGQADATGTATQYAPGGRGAGVNNSNAFFDIALQQDFNLFKLSDSKPVAAWVKLNVTNLFNHQQVATIITGYKPADNLTDPWVAASPNYGKAPSPANYAEARQLALSVGIKF